MKVFVDPAKGPLAGLHPAVYERRMEELVRSLAECGLTLSDTVNEDGSLNISLRNFEARHRTRMTIRNADPDDFLDNGESNAVIAALDSLGTVRVDLEPADLERLGGGADIFSHAAARGLEAGSEVVAKHVTGLTPTEIFPAVDSVATVISSNDFSDDPEQNAKIMEVVRPGILQDLYQSGLIDGMDDKMDTFEAAMRAKSDPLPPVKSGEFAEDAPRPYRSPFEESF